MKTYIVYCDGVEVGMIKADSHNDAEKKAKKLHGGTRDGAVDHWTGRPVERDVSVAYTEV